MALAFRSKNDRWAAVGAVSAVLAFACEPNLVVGKWTSKSGTEAGSAAEAGSATGGTGGTGAGAGTEAGAGAEAGGASGAGAGGDSEPGGVGASCDGAAGESAIPAIDAPLALPWSTGFEDGICGYKNAGGYCYAEEDASYEIVSAPVHSGDSAAAFSLANGTVENMQARCVRQGTLPNAAYYSAFFLIPSAPTSATNWNLIHFRGAERPGARRHGLWDVSLARQPDGTYQVYVFDFLRAMTRSANNVPPVPIGSWFQLEVYLKRATGPTGAFEVRQDGKLALGLSGLSTDDTTFGQWYVGSLAFSLTPPESVVYVDDVSIRELP
jgi:hypothetical protein